MTVYEHIGAILGLIALAAIAVLIVASVAVIMIMMWKSIKNDWRN